MSKRLSYLDWLQLAKAEELRGNFTLAVSHLDTARQHTWNSEELAHLDLWQKRLQREQPPTPPTKGRSS